MTSSSELNPAPLDPKLMVLMALATGLAVASNYYPQPLLHTIALAFDVPYSTAGLVITVAQLSYAAGLLLLVPLGDLFERRSLIVSMTLMAAAGLALSANADHLSTLLLGTAITGLFSVVAQVLVPFAATLAAPSERGRVIGAVMSGLLLGILLARTVAGALSSWGDWRLVYILASILMVFMAIALGYSLPRYATALHLSYPQLLLSVGRLFLEEPQHRLRTALGALCFASFALFWTPLAFLLASPPYEYSDAQTGLLGLVGAAGALAANITGRLADRGFIAQITTVLLWIMTGSWLLLDMGSSSILALLGGVLLLDLAVQGCHISNQNAVFRLRPEARNRLNAGYMTGYFLGGALGSALSAILYQYTGWTGVCVAGGVLGVLALGLWFGAAH